MPRASRDSAIAGVLLVLLAKWAEGRFDLVFMDIQMPELDGLEAARRIRRSEQSTGEHVPIVAMTAHAMRADVERCRAAGMDGYISKPISQSAVRKVLASAGGSVTAPERS